jgi:hypothetical protein
MSTDDGSGEHRPDPFFARQVEAMAGYGLPAEVHRAGARH